MDGFTDVLIEIVTSQLDWPEKALRIRQETRFPESEGTRLTVAAQKPAEFDIRIRVPYWATRGVTATVNGQAVPNPPRPGTFWPIHRVWKDGDVLEVRTPMALHIQAMPDDATLQAIMYGPLVLAGQLGNEGLKYEMMYGDPKEPKENYYLRGEPVSAPEFRATASEPAAWIKPVPDQPLTFRTSGQKRDVTLVPLNQLFEERYAVYWRVRPIR